MSEEAFGSGFPLDLFPVLVLRSVVEGHGLFESLGNICKPLSQSVDSRFASFVFEFRHEQKTDFSFDCGIQSRLVILRLDAVTFPISDALSIFNDLRTLIDRNTHWFKHSLALSEPLGHTPSPSAAQIPSQVFSVSPKVRRADTVLREDELVDRFVRDRLSNVDLHPPGDLLRRPSQPEMLPHIFADLPVFQSERPASALPILQSPLVRQPWRVLIPFRRKVPLDLPRHRRRRPAQFLGNAPDRPFLPQTGLDRFTLLNSKVCVFHASYFNWCCTWRLNVPYYLLLYKCKNGSI